MNDSRTYPPGSEDSGVPPARSDEGRPGQEEPKSNQPLNWNLDKLLDTALVIKPVESAQPMPAREPVKPTAATTPAVSTWQRAKSSATKTLRAAAARRQSRSDGPSAITMPQVQSKPPAKLKTKARTSTQKDDNGRQKIMMALIPVLATALVLAIKNPLKVSPAAATQNTQPAVATPAPVVDVEIAWEIPSLYQPGERDPMHPVESPENATPETPDQIETSPKQTRIQLVVSGILYSPDRPAAIVDTQLVHEGQQISGATVKKIEKNGVEFEWNGQTWRQAVDP